MPSGSKNRQAADYYPARGMSAVVQLARRLLQQVPDDTTLPAALGVLDYLARGALKRTDGGEKQSAREIVRWCDEARCADCPIPPETLRAIKRLESSADALTRKRGYELRRIARIRGVLPSGRERLPRSSAL